MDLNNLQSWLPNIARLAYFVAAVLFILGIKRMSSPVTARKGIVQAGWGMVIATVASLYKTRVVDKKDGATAEDTADGEAPAKPAE